MNGYVLFLASFLVNTYYTNAYVLLQVRNKGFNHSDIDAIIHKSISSDKADQLTKKIARKHNVVKPEMRSRDDKEHGNIYVTIDDSKEKKKSTVINDMEQVIGVLLDKITKMTETGFNYRSRDPMVVPKHVNLRSKPSLMYEVNTNSILDVMNHVLASEPVKKFVDTVSKNAAAVYRTHF